MKKITTYFEKKSLWCIGFYQALGLTLYCGLVGLIFWNGDKWFGPMNQYLGPVLLLVILVTSVVISALIVFGYPFILFWEKKETSKALKLVSFTALWLLVFIFVIIIIIKLF